MIGERVPGADYLGLFSRFCLATIFILAGLSKLSKKHEFDRAIRGFKLVPRRYVRYVAAWLPRFELATGLLMAFGIFTVLAAALGGLTLLVFTAVVATALARRRTIDCGCFGQFGKPITWLTVARNTVLLATALAVVVARPAAVSIAPIMGADPAPGSTGYEPLAAVIPSTLVVLVALVFSQWRTLLRSATVVVGGQEA
ncbi:MAG: DoxX family membrane protein [Actinobacteria bacterium]|nr:DoxX family membrane protein [Actinomycetota bacterium]